MKKGEFDISNTASNGKNYSAVRVRKNGVKICEVLMGTISNPLQYLRAHNGAYRASFFEQLRVYGMVDSEIYKLLEK